MQTVNVHPRLVWENDELGNYKPFLIDGKKRTSVVWAPQAGSQQAFLECPITEVLYEGTRGPGKTDALLMDFAQFVGKGWGKEWKGILFRRTYPELQDVIDKSKKWFPLLFGSTCRYNEAKSQWEWDSGEKLYFRHFKKESDYWSYHGHAYPWIGWEELTTWPDDKCFKSMFACSRSPVKGIPIRIRATCNPYGVGHNWVKSRYRLPVRSKSGIIGEIIDDARDSSGEIEPTRVAIHGTIYENKILLNADPKYIQRISAAARNDNERKAWLYGDWDIVAGGMFDDVWDPKIHIIPNIPFELIPRTWLIDRSYDHGSSAPFSVGWWAESNGEPFEYGGKRYGQVKGDLIRISEWYGWRGTPNEGVRMLAGDIAEGIRDREADWELTGRVKAGPADSAIFDDYEPGNSVEGDMRKKGVTWLAADKGPGSRRQGWEQIRKYMKNAKPIIGSVREEPGIFVTERCTNFIRTIPVLPRDDKDLDDVDTEAEDHIGDETRYRLRKKRRELTAKSYK